MTSNVQKKIVHRYQVGMQVVDSGGRVLGDMTSVFQEGNRLFAVVNGDYEVDLTGAAEIVDLCGTLRQATPALKDPHIRLGALAGRAYEREIDLA
ncbi:hypothetical protein A8H39_00140 [Paraburkholderia fungorum]|uniref:hypothetical protein n=1 Tax=Paraburkholderia fungorum TaxID=134537 RepID=UPI000486518C|nr:hypothetical protein [Paraburkholderia fungorum]PNE59594.1 hypothetical protein A8H39_00140 [Paraburkholderia fungorum]